MEKRSVGKYDLIGERFFHLLVVEKAHRDNRRRYWKCLCDCGNYCYHTADQLKKGSYKSCGCKKIKHGLTHSRIRSIYVDMIRRCYNPKDTAYKNYGGRGITICDEWLGENGLINFNEWARNNGYAENLTIDRIDNNGNYEPNNCRWATYRQQANNRRTNIFVTHNGETHTLSEWERILNFPKNTLHQRKKLGWSYEKALTTPIKKAY